MGASRLSRFGQSQNRGAFEGAKIHYASLVAGESGRVSGDANTPASTASFGRGQRRRVVAPRVEIDSRPEARASAYSGTSTASAYRRAFAFRIEDRVCRAVDA